jgi:muramoyltetrapeptide carboxypeptidase
MRKPPALRPGDRIAVVAPASPFPTDEFDRGLDELRRRGFEPVFDERVFAANRYLAGDAALRAASLLDAWRAADVAAVVAARGGYGSAQVLPLVGDALRSLPPKVFVGSSDLTAVLSWLTTKCGVVAMHGPMVAGQLSRGSDGFDAASWMGALTCTTPLGAVADDVEVFARGEADGVLVGGNLTQLAASLGTPWAFDPPEGCVLFLEDVNERPYRIDRLLTQLRLAGIFARASALVFGEMLGCDERDGSVRAWDAVTSCIAGFPGPVIAGIPAGHTSGPALTLPLGVRARVTAAARGRLVIEESSVL